MRKATNAIVLNRKVNHMAKDKFIQIVANDRIRNNPITVGDIRRSHIIYGPPLPSIKERTRYKESKWVKETQIVEILESLYEDLKHITLCADFHYVNGIAVFYSISRRIDYRTVSFLLTRSKATIVKQLNEILKVYNARGFKITELQADSEFTKIEKDILPVRLHTCGTDDHVPEVEQSVQTQKNENRSLCHSMPYKYMPRVMIRELIQMGNTLLNAFGSKESIASGLSPHNVIDGLPHVDYNDLKFEFGQYVQLHVEQKVTNTMKSCTIGAIVLGPKSIQGRYNYMSLETGKLIDGRVVARMPINDDVIARVEQLGTEQNQPLRTSKMLKYEWRPGLAFDDQDAHLQLQDLQQASLIPPLINQLEHELDLQNNNYYTRLADNDVDSEDNEFYVEVGHHQRADEMGNDGDNRIEQGANRALEADTIEHDETQGAEDQGAEDQGAEVQGAEPPRNDEAGGQSNDGDDNENDDDNNKSESEDSEDSSDSESDTEQCKEEHGRRSDYFADHNNNQYGRGKCDRSKPSNEAYSFLQTKFKDLSDDDKRSYFRKAWSEYKTSGKTNMLEKFTCGLAFAQLSAKQGIKKYEREAELKLLNEFKQLMEYKTFHRRKADELSAEEKCKSANMINLIEEKTNRGHAPENPVIKGRKCFQWEGTARFIHEGRDSIPHRVPGCFFPYKSHRCNRRNRHHYYRHQGSLPKCKDERGSNHEDHRTRGRPILRNRSIPERVCNV